MSSNPLIVSRLSALPRPLQRHISRYVGLGAEIRADGALTIGPAPWIAPEAVLFLVAGPADQELLAAASRTLPLAIPDTFVEFLRTTNGCFAYDLWLGAVPRTALLDRATLQPPRLDLANRDWRHEYAGVPPRSVHVGGRAWNADENIGYFMMPDGVVEARRKAGEVLGSWANLDAALDEELAAAEVIARRDAPPGALGAA
jgi:hypothetical protein